MRRNTLSLLRLTGYGFSEKHSLIAEKPKRAVKVKEKLILGVPESEIKAKARIGESWEGAAARISKEKKGV